MDLHCVEAVVVELAGIVARAFGLDANMRKAVELRPDLANFRAEILFVGNDLVAPDRAEERRARDLEVPAARPKEGHAGLIHATEAVDFASLYQRGRFQHFGRGHEVRRTRLIRCAPPRRKPLLRHGPTLWWCFRHSGSDWLPRDAGTDGETTECSAFQKFSPRIARWRRVRGVKRLSLFAHGSPFLLNMLRKHRKCERNKPIRLSPHPNCARPGTRLQARGA